MKKVFACLAFIITVFNCSWAQLQIDQGMTVEQYVQDVLVGAGVTVTNVTFTGLNNQIGEFDNGNTTNIGLADGLILGTGNVDVAIGPNDDNGAGNRANGRAPLPDPDLNTLLTGSTNTDQFDLTILEFDFIPVGDEIEFNYIFASEEYPEFVGREFNDVFGLFLSGPGINGPFTDGAINIATLPNGGVVSIDNVNNGNPNPPTVAPNNNVFYTDNGDGNFFNPDPTSTIQYDGFTVPITARANVQSCETYHIKIALADVKDPIFDSGVFLEGGSFSSNGISTDVSYENTVTNEALEGCAKGFILFELSNNALTDSTIKFTIGGTAINGVDYTTIPDSVVIPAGEDSYRLEIDPLVDTEIEGIETVSVSFNFINDCNANVDVFSEIRINEPSDVIPGDIEASCFLAGVPLVADQLGEFEWYTEMMGGDLLTTSTNRTPSADVDTGRFTQITGVSPNRMFTVYVQQAGINCGRTEVTFPETCIPCDSAYIVQVSYENTSLNRVLEGCFAGFVDISLLEITPVDSVISFTIGGSADNSTDYTQIQNTVTVPAGDSTVRIQIDGLVDNTLEGQERIVLEFDNSATCRGSETPNAVVRIIDPRETAGGTNFVYCDTLLTAFQTNSIGDFEWYDSPSGGNLLATSTNTDYSSPFNISDILEVSGTAPNRIFTAYVIDPALSCTRTRVDVPENCTQCELPYLASVSYERPSLNAVLEGCYAGFVDVSLRETTPEDSVVNYMVTGTATNGTDYLALPGTITIPAGNISARITISGLEDVVLEGMERLTITLLNPNLCLGETNPSVQVNIRDQEEVEATNNTIICNSLSTTFGSTNGTVNWFDTPTGENLLATSTGGMLSSEVNLSTITEVSGTAPNRVFTVYAIDSSTNCSLTKIDLQEMCPPCPDPMPNIISNSLSICVTDTIDLEAEDLMPGEVSEYVWLFNGDTITNSNTFTLTNVTNPGTYEFVAIEPQCGDKISSSIVVGRLDLNVDAKANNVNPIKLKQGEIGRLFGEINGDSFTWILPTDPGSVALDSLTDLKTSFKAIKTGDHYLYLQTELGSCTALDSVLIRITGPISAPNVFTPNGDGDNDTFVIKGIETNPEARVLIFNRWGILLYETENYLSREWDGLNAPDGVYYYVVELSPDDEPGEGHSGVIHLIR